MVDSNWIIKEHLKVNPLHIDYKKYWSEQIRNSIDGIWYKGVWIPPTLYMFANMWHIKLQRKGGGEYIGRPNIRPDIEWDKHLLYTEARGFSGFELDTKYTCDRRYLELEKDFPEYWLLSDIEINVNLREKLEEKNYKRETIDFRKRYISAREYLRKRHSSHLGKALYENECKNIVDIETRGSGKSYTASCIAGQNFLFDGAKDYDDYISRIKAKKDILTSETCIGAIDSKYADDLCSKIILGLSNLPGACEFNGYYYPSPLFKNYKGSLQSGSKKTIESGKAVIKSGNEIWEGSGSKIHNRSFRDNPFVFNGTRPNLVIIEEVGFASNLLETNASLKDCTTPDGKKSGVIWFTGTGGDMEGGSTQGVKRIFYNPELYDCLEFDNIYEENKLSKIGYFLPAIKVQSKARDENFVLNEKYALSLCIKDREKAKNKSLLEYNKILQNNPLIPSEAFMLASFNKFPVEDINNRIAELEGNQQLINSFIKAEMILVEGKYPEIKLSNKDIIRDYPYDNRKGTDTAIEIYNLPKKDPTTNIAYSNRYIAGLDPVDDDGVKKESSLQSFFIMDLWTDEIVVEYTGRTMLVKDYYEQCRRLLLFYNARLNYESNKKGVFSYFETKNSLYLLTDNLESLSGRDIQKKGSIGNMTKGTVATPAVINHSLDLILDYIETITGETKNLNKIYSLGLLRELTNYSEEDNFDRVRALGMLMLLREDKLAGYQSYKQKVLNPVKEDNFWDRKYVKYRR